MSDAIPRTASVTCGMGFYLASDRGDVFKEVKHGVCPRRNLQKAEEALSGVGEVAVAPSMEVSGVGEVARAVREPREDGVRSVGVPSTRRLWGVLRRLLPGLADSVRLEEKSWQTCTTNSRVVESFELVLPRDMSQGLASSVRLEEESWQTCTTNIRVVESFELVLPRGMPQ
ncbi:hypothetical protein Taro_053077, partial [Colocasia esculenta]|nr:hypothetical protein [Colocasia esculenta]